MTSAVCVLMAVCLASVIAAPSNDQLKDENKRHVSDHRGQCFHNEGVFEHGQLVISAAAPCLEYRCEDGHMALLTKACSYEDVCHPVGSVWKARDCHTYTCQRTGYHTFSVDRLRSGCLDAYGRCHNPGDIFPYPRNGRIVPQCTCRTTPDMIVYDCY